MVIYPASGTGAWEAALSNTLSTGDQVLMYETGQFAALWIKMARRLSLNAEVIGWNGADEHVSHAERVAAQRTAGHDRAASAAGH